MDDPKNPFHGTGPPDHTVTLEFGRGSETDGVEGCDKAAFGTDVRGDRNGLTSDDLARWFRSDERVHVYVHVHGRAAESTFLRGHLVLRVL